METDEIRAKLIIFIEKNRPLISSRNSRFIILRTDKLEVISAGDLRIGDIRILQLEAVDLVKGLSPEQWTTLFEKTVKLTHIVKVDLFADQNQKATV